MKRRFLVALFLIVCAACLAFALFSCGTNNDSTLEMEEGIVYFTDFSIKYTSAEDSPNGDIDESSLTDEISGSVQSYYLVMNFDMQLASNTDGLEYITVKFVVLDAGVVETIVNYADTSNTSAITSDGQTTVTATFSMPDKARSVKNINLVLELKPKAAGATDIYYSFLSNTKNISGYIDEDIKYNYTSSSISTSKTSFEYTLNEDGQSYSVTGVGTKIGASHIKEIYNGLSVTAIGNFAFENNATLTSITISDSVTTIGDAAFYNCISLESIIIPDSITSISDSVFYNCTSLTDVTIPNSVTSIGVSAFYGCTAITNIIIPDSVTSIGNYAFSNCTTLESITLPFVGGSAFDNTFLGYIFGADSNSSNAVYIPSSLKTVVITGGSNISEKAFYDCTSLTSVTISDSVKSIGEGAFSGCSSLVSLVLPFVGGSVKTESDTYQYPFGYIFGTGNYTGGAAAEQYYYGSSTSSTTSTTYYIPVSLTTVTITGGNILCGSFYNCTSLTSVTIPDSVTSIGVSAFNGCISLTSMTISDSITSIGKGAFSGCSSLVSMTLPFVGGNSTATSASSTTLFGYIFGTSSYTGGTSTKQYYSSRSSSTYYIPSTLKEVTITGGNILYGAFYGCSSLTNITIPDSVTSIGVSAFKSCTSLESITIPDSVTSIGNSAFSHCYSLTSITIPDSVTSIGDSAFYESTSLTNVIIGNGVTSIGEGTFYICTALTNVIIGNGVTSIGSYAFYNCTSLKSVTIPDSVTSIGERAFESCTSLTSITIPDSVTSIGSYAFYNCTSLEIVNIGNGITHIYQGTFYSCTSLACITLGSSVASIGYNAFWINSLTSISVNTDNTTYKSIDGNLYSYDGTNLIQYAIAKTDTTFIIPDCVTSIGEKAFYYCKSLTSITIPDSVTSIGINAFCECTSLTSINIPDRVTSIGYSAFYYCTSLTSITIPDSVISIGEHAFWYCTSLTSVTIGNGVTFIGDHAFWYCTSLTSITIPDSVTSIGNNAFNSCTSLTSVTIGSGVIAIGSGTFGNCISLIDININSVNTAYKSIDGNLYNYDGTLLIKYATGKTDTSFTIPDSVTSISDSAFGGCTSLTSVTIPDSVTSIGGYAFSGCTSLTSVIIGSSVASIEYHTFYGCTSLTSVTFKNTSGWYRTETEGATSGTDILSSDLENTSTAAKYLSNPSYYLHYYWYRRGN